MSSALPSSSRGRCRWPPASCAGPARPVRPAAGTGSSAGDPRAPTPSPASPAGRAGPRRPAREQRDPRSRSHAPDAHDLAGDVDELESLEQSASIVGQGRPVGAEQLVQALRTSSAETPYVGQIPPGPSRGIAHDPTLSVDHLGELREGLEAVLRPCLRDGFSAFAASFRWCFVASPSPAPAPPPHPGASTRRPARASARSRPSPRGRRRSMPWRRSVRRHR